MLDFKYLPTYQGDKKKAFHGKKSKRNKDSKQMSRKKSKNSSKQKAQNQQSKFKNNDGYFICYGSYRAQDCLKKDKIIQLIGDSPEGNGSGKAIKKAILRMTSLQLLLNVFNVNKPLQCRLMCVIVKVNNKKVLALLDTSAIYNFIVKSKVADLCLKVSKVIVK